MMEGKALRKADFVTSIILMLFGIWIISQALQMPMTATYGGVNSVWYLSPALMPLVIGGALIVLGTVLLVNSIRTGGAVAFIQSLRQVKLRLSDGMQRFLGIILALATFVYLFIPRVDFFLSILLFLSYFVPAYFYDDMPIFRRLSLVYSAVSLLFVILFATPLAALLNGAFEFSTDVIALVSIIVLFVYARVRAQGNALLKRRFHIGLIVSIATPLILTPIFRFALLVPFPREGGIVQVMQLIFYSLR